MKIVLSTRNPSKAEQARAEFKDSAISILTLDEAGIDGQAVENGDTLKKNARIKAWFAHERRPDTWTIADDTGIFVVALGGKPGVDTANWNGGNKETSAMTAWIIEQLKGVSNRAATFQTVVALVSPEGETHFFSGEVRGKILETPRPATQPKMPYAPIFMPDGTDRVWGEMTVEEENEISHRGKAFRQAREFLERMSEQERRLG